MPSEDSELQIQGADELMMALRLPHMSRAPLKSSQRPTTMSFQYSSHGMCGPVDYVKTEIEEDENSVLHDQDEAWVGCRRCFKVEIHGQATLDKSTAGLTRHGFAAKQDDYHAFGALHGSSSFAPGSTKD